MKNKYKSIIIFLLLTIVILVGTIFVLKTKNNSINNTIFILYGNEEVSIYENDTYYELGFLALDKNNNKLNEKVIIESNLDPSNIGTYTINYTLNRKTLTRTVKVIKDPLKDIEFTLNGNKIVNINKNEEFIDPLVKCVNIITNSDLSSNVIIENNIDKQVVGSYEVKYKLIIDTKEKILTRTVNVLENKYTALLSNDKPTNQDVSIRFTSNITNFSYILKPNGEMIYESNLDYIVNENGDYKFTVYDNEKSFEEYVITINNIDKTIPAIISCNGFIKNNQTTYNVVSNDTDIISYIINNDNTLSGTTSPFTINQVIENGKVTVYDEAQNNASIECKTIYSEISPTGNETIVKNASSDTLKVWIEKKARSGRTSYYVTHIWAKDAYNQFKTNVPNKFGGELIRAKALLDNAVKKHSLSNKIAVAVNASGFILNGTWGQKYYNANHAWNKTSGSPIVIVEGKVLRDFATKKIPSSPYTTYGLKKDGYLGYYKYVGGTNDQTNINSSNKIISDGVLNTMAFNPVLVNDKKVASSDTSKNIRQGFCQIDKNNFVFVTDIYNSSRNGFSFKELGNYMISIGCKTGFNLDGGGSTSLIYKSQNGGTETITGNNRNIADIAFFHE